MTQDPGLKALMDVYDALKNLDEVGKRWVLDSISKKFFQGKSGSDAVTGQMENGVSKLAEKMGLKQIGELAEVFAICKPKTESEKALVAAAYLQEKEDKKELTGRDINGPLNHLGKRVGNITNAISILINANPSLMIQLRKEGKTRQATKKYKVTVAGIDKVNEMLGHIES